MRGIVEEEVMFYLYGIIIFVLLLFFYMWREAHRNSVKEDIIYFQDFPGSFKQFRVFFISDIHRRKVSQQMINSVMGKVDIVVIGGDLAEKGVPLERVKDNILRLKKLGPTYFVWGNNDYELDYHMLDALLLDSGIKILDNTAVIFESQTGDKVALLGVDDLNEQRDRLDLALLDANKVAFKILISHDPRIVRKIKPEDDIQFVLSGHTHGGQIRFLNFGLYEKGKISKRGATTLLVSNGYGTTAVPLRLGAPPETHLLTLTGVNK